MNHKLNDQLRALDDKNNNLRYAQNAMKNHILERDKSINSLQEELRNVEGFRLEKEKSERLISNLSNTVNTLKELLDRKSKRIKDLEKQNIEYLMPKLINDTSDKSGNVKQTISDISFDKLREKLISTLEIENKKLKDKWRKNDLHEIRRSENNIEIENNKTIHTNDGIFPL